jgi:ubiquinone/menaquinone biosynthesis C-methylase UbiE
MSIVDKRGILSRFPFEGGAHVELGCGERKRLPQAIGIDSLDYECVDIVGDALEALRAFPDGSINSIASFHFIEHLSDVSGLMDEVARVLVRGGVANFVAPHFSNPYFYSDYTHKSFFGLYTFCYLCSCDLFGRQVPTYKKVPSMNLEKVDLVFKSAKPFYIRYLLKSLLGKIINTTNYGKEFYEENLTYILPCYEVRYLMRKM